MKRIIISLTLTFLTIVPVVHCGGSRGGNTTVEPGTDDASVDPEGCVNLIPMFDSSLDDMEDVGQARELFRTSCDGDDARGCMILGLCLVLLEEDDDAQVAFEKSCELGNVTGCLSLANLWYQDRGTPPAGEELDAFYDTVCDFIKDPEIAMSPPFCPELAGYAECIEGCDAEVEQCYAEAEKILEECQQDCGEIEDPKEKNECIEECDFDDPNMHCYDDLKWCEEDCQTW